MKKVYLVAVVVALIAGICTFLFANQLFKTVSAKSADTTKVLVPTIDIEPSKVLDATTISTNFVEKDVFTKDLIDNVVLSQEDLLNKVTYEKLYANEQINRNRLTDEDSENATLSLKLKEGEVAMTIKANDKQGVDGYIDVGDTVDLLYIPIDTEKLKDIVNGTEDENNEGGSQSSDTDKQSKNSKKKDNSYTNEKGEFLYGKDKITLKEFYDMVAVEKVKNLEVLKISDHSSSNASEESGSQLTTYTNITLRVPKEQADLLKQIETCWGPDSYTLVLNKKAK